MTRSQLDRTLLLWVLPLLIAPPMYSRDVYSYLAQSEIAINGLDPYKVGPATGLGLDHVFTLSVPTCGARPRARTVRCFYGSDRAFRR
jgi:alpha-1,6-mannosyltransferase